MDMSNIFPAVIYQWELNFHINLRCKCRWYWDNCFNNNACKRILLFHQTFKNWGIKMLSTFIKWKRVFRTIPWKRALHELLAVFYTPTVASVTSEWAWHSVTITGRSGMFLNEMCRCEMKRRIFLRWFMIIHRCSVFRFSNLC